MIKQGERDISTLEHMVKHCETIEKAFERFGRRYDDFVSDEVFRDAVSMNILQIGELTGHLSDEFKERTKDSIPWREIRSMRNWFAHDYVNMDNETIWKTAFEDVPILLDFCREQLQKLQTKDERPSVIEFLRKQSEEQKQSNNLPNHSKSKGKSRNDHEL